MSNTTNREKAGQTEGFGLLLSCLILLFSHWIYPYMIVSPLVVLALLMLAFHLLADGLREIFDPTRADR